MLSVLDRPSVCLRAPAQGRVRGFANVLKGRWTTPSPRFCAGVISEPLRHMCRKAGLVLALDDGRRKNPLIGNGRRSALRGGAGRVGATRQDLILRTRVAVFGWLMLAAGWPGPVEIDDERGHLAAANVDLRPREMATLGAAICGAPLAPVGDGGIGCTACPTFTPESGSDEGLVIRNLLRGQFSGSGRDELLLDTSGCEPHAAEFGGALILEPVGDGWRRVWYQSGLRLDDCIAFTGRTRDRLVCNERFSGQGTRVGEVSEIWVEPQGAQRRRLLRWADNLDSDSHRLVSLTPESVQAADLNGDARVDLRIHLSLIQTRLPDRYTDLATAQEAGYALPEPSPEVVDFLQGPEGFSPAPSARARLSRLEQMLRPLLE
jgi:hypothetical protein